MYDLSAKDYYDLYTKIDKISMVRWWRDILNNNQTQIQKGVKRTQQEIPIKATLRADAPKEPSKKRVKFV